MTGHCTGVILAGGQATRYGRRPKGLERVGGARIVDRVADALRQSCDALLLVANDAAADSWLPGVRAVTDVRPGLGALGGIHSALVRAGGPVLVVAWDMPFVPAALLAELRRLGEQADAAAPESSASRRGLEPTCAYYGPSCLAAIERRIAADDRRVVSFFEDVRVARLPADRVARYGDPDVLFMNVNTPEDLSRAEAHATATDGRRDRA
ncbi:MAG: molybdenum cofactor guanylyltransferase [Gemmatimonadaceae bacterium]